MKYILLLKVISMLGLILTILPSFLVFYSLIDLNLNKQLMFAGTAIWFISAPLWMNKAKKI